MNKRGLVALAGLAMTTGAMATPTCLILMPIADVLGRREVLYALSANGYERHIEKKYLWSHTLTIGLGGGFEIGAANDFSGSTQLDVKAQLLSGPNYAISAGLYNYDVDGKTFDHYIVGRFDFSEKDLHQLKGLRAHAGWLRSDESRVMLGVDFGMNAGWSGMVDYISGTGSYVWSGINIPTRVPGLVITPMFGIPTHHEDGYQHAIAFNYGFRF